MPQFESGWIGTFRFGRCDGAGIMPSRTMEPRFHRSNANAWSGRLPSASATASRFRESRRLYPRFDGEAELARFDEREPVAAVGDVDGQRAEARHDVVVLQRALEPSPSVLVSKAPGAFELVVVSFDLTKPARVRRVVPHVLLAPPHLEHELRHDADPVADDAPALFLHDVDRLDVLHELGKRAVVLGDGVDLFEGCLDPDGRLDGGHRVQCTSRWVAANGDPPAFARSSSPCR